MDAVVWGAVNVQTALEDAGIEFIPAEEGRG
jgi:hypothetical protein